MIESVRKFTGGLAVRRGSRGTRATIGGALITAAVVTSSVLVHAQHRIVFNHLGVKQGLSQGGVNCIFQDSWGFMWFGTQDGLNRFDGYEFKVFKRDPADSTTLNENWILLIAETPDRTLWIGTRGNPKVLNRFDRASQTFTQVPLDSVDLWHARTGASKPTYEDTYGEQWAGVLPTGGGLSRFDPKSGRKAIYKHDPSDPKSLIDDRVYCVYGDRLGTIWIATHEGLDRFDRKTGVFIHYTHDEKNPASLSDNWVWPILEDRNGNLWVGTMRGGLNRFDRSTETFTRFRHAEADPQSLSDDRIFSLYQDQSGMIWLGTGEHGIDRFHPEFNAFGHFARDPLRPASLVNNNILSLFVDGMGKTWIGTRGGLETLDRRSGEFTHIVSSPPDPRRMPGGMVQCFAEDKSGNLWIGTESSGLDRYDRKTGTFSHFKHDDANPASLSDNRVYALCEDREGFIWVGTYGGGLNRLDPRTGNFVRYVHSDSIPGSLGGRGVFALAEDHEGVLWVGTFGGGLDRFNRESGTFTHFKHDEANPASLSDDVVACIHEDRGGTLWVGTAGGLNRLDRGKGSFRQFHVKDGLPNDVVFGILEDNQGNLWMSTNKGLSKFDPRRETFRNFDYDDGLQGDEFNQGAFARDLRTGEMYFGGSNGFNVFHPDSVRENTYAPPVVFSSFTRYNTDDKEGKPIEEPGVDAKSSITLSYKDNVANLEFAALNYYNTFKNQYAYKLEGFSDNWIQLGVQRTATFTNLDAGEYTLRVKGSNNDGLWNETGAVLLLSVTPPWWKTRWAYGTYAFLAFGFLYGVRRFEINRREQKAQVRESRLQAKAAEAEKRALEAENERKTKELDDARLLQLSMLPREVPKVPGFEIAVFMKTATEVGGDYYDFSLAEDGTLNIGFGDATGHGMQAGTIVTLMKGLFVSDAARFDIQTFFGHCSAAIKQIRLARLFMAFTLVRLKGNSVSFSCAGMPPVYLYRKDSSTVEEILLKGMPLGAMKNFPYALHEDDLRTGDTVLLLTDGLPEQKNVTGEMFDYARVQDALAAVGDRSPEEIVRHLAEAGESWMTGAVQDDDVTMMVIRRTER